MKRNLWHLAVMSIAYPASLFALGMGDMTVQSYLNQPFKAQIELIDVGRLPLDGIKVSLASEEDYKEANLEQPYAATYLSFKVGKNKSGKPVIFITSSDLIDDPYLDVIVDMSWSNGQLFRAYTVLLDPPDYNLTRVKIHASETRLRSRIRKPLASDDGVVHKEVYSHVGGFDEAPLATSAKTYGPVLKGETIWQIAQRFKTQGLELPQIVLAIVGENPSSFEMGNLNGLKSASKLTIPSANVINKIPEEAAKLEVLAHDQAWRERQPIRHVILPPYVDGILAVHKPENENNANEQPKESPVDSILSQIAPKPSLSDTTKSTQSSDEQQLKAELSVMASSLEAVQEANHQLTDKISSLENQNKQLQEALRNRDKDLAEIKATLASINVQRQAVTQTVQGTSLKEDDEWVLWPYWLLLFLLLGGGAGVLWYFKQHPKKPAPNIFDNTPEPEEPVVEEPVVEEPVVEEPVVEEPVVEEPVVEEPVVEEPVVEEPVVEEPVVEEPVVEEPVVEEPVVEEPVVEEPVVEEPVAEEPVAEEPVVEEPVVEEPVVEEPVVEEPVVEEPVVEEPVVEEPVVEEPVVEEPVVKNPVVRKDKKSSVRKSSDDEFPADEYLMNFDRPLAGLVPDMVEKVKDVDVGGSETAGEIIDDEYILDFEPGLSEEINEAPVTTPAQESSHDDEHVLDFDISDLNLGANEAVEDETVEILPESVHDDSDDSQSIDETDEFIGLKQATAFAKQPLGDFEKPLKNYKALDTLLALAKTYVSMQDYEAARQSLEEVLQYGNDSQQQEAKKLLDELEKGS